MLDCFGTLDKMFAVMKQSSLKKVVKFTQKLFESFKSVKKEFFLIAKNK